MSGYKRVSKEIKDEVLERVRSGVKVSDLSEQYGISSTTIYKWLRVGIEGGVSLMEYSKVKRERDDLLKIIGELTLQTSRRKKNNNNSSYGR